jgi:hypothetical protein
VTSAADRADHTDRASTAPAPPRADRRTLARMRAGLLVLAGFVVLGTAFELYAARHWLSAVQLVAWAAVALLALAVPLARRPGTVLAARGLAGLVLVASAVGVLQHVLGNYAMGFAAAQAQGLALPERVWAALTMATGHAPPLAPGLLGQGALLVLLATVGLRRRGTTV